MRADSIEIKSEDPVQAKYEAIGKVIQRNKEGLARLEKEQDAEERR